MPLFDLAPGGVYQPPRSPGMLVVSYTTVSPLPVLTGVGHRRFGFCGTVPSGCPAWALPSSLSYGVRTFLDALRGVLPRPSGGLATSQRTGVWGVIV